MALVITIKRDVEIIGVQDESRNNVICLLLNYYDDTMYNSMEGKINVAKKKSKKDKTGKRDTYLLVHS